MHVAAYLQDWAYPTLTDVFWSLLRASEFAGRLERVEEKQARQDAVLEHGVRPIIGKLARLIEHPTQEPDSLPPAASAEYEWHRALRDAKSSVDELVDEFADLPLRLSHHLHLIRLVQRLVDIAHADRDRSLASAALTIHDSLRSVYSEDLTEHQTLCMRDAIQGLSEPRWDTARVRELDRLLRRVGFETVPSDRFVEA